MGKKYRVEIENGYIEYKSQAEALEAHPNETATELDHTPQAVNKPLKAWEEQIKSAEREISTVLEHIIDSMSATQKARIPNETLDKYNNKKILRENKPA